MAGLFDIGDTEEEGRQNMGLLGMMTGLGIMQANQPGASMGQAVGAGGMQGLQGMMQMRQQRGTQQLRALQMQKLKQDMAQQAQWQKMFGGETQGLDPYAASQMSQEAAGMGLDVPPQNAPSSLSAVPESMRPFVGAMGPQAGSRFVAGVLAKQAGIGVEDPATVREYQFFDKLSPEEQSKFLTMKRANPYLNLGGSMVQPNPVAPGQAMGSFATTLKPGDLPETRGAQATAAAAGTATGSATAQAALDLPKVISQGEDTIRLVDDILKHPGMKDVVGMPESISGVARSLTGSAIPGTDAANFTARLDELKGKQFLQAFESLKGAGQITEVEGAKATDAISRMQKTGQTEAEFKKAAKEYQDVIRGAINRAKMKAGQSAGGASGGWSIKRVD